MIHSAKRKMRLREGGVHRYRKLNNTVHGVFQPKSGYDLSQITRRMRFVTSTHYKDAHCVVLDFLTSGHRSRGHRSDLLKVPKEDDSPTLPLSAFPLPFPRYFLALYPVYRLFSARPYSQWNFSLVNKLSLHETQSQLSVLSRYFYVTLNLLAVKTV